jgi:DNA-binding ferritin-like protein
VHNVASFYRYLQLFAHIAHNKAKGQSFFADHEELGELYGAYETAYDSVVERMIGIGEGADLFIVNDKACKMLTMISGDYTNDESFGVLLQGERDLCELLGENIKSGGYTQGTINLLAQLYDDSEARQYKFSQRLTQ